ncbi:MAG: hypothetical protein ACI8RZ_002599 [Myxococcota bacterium]|jgi:hypothetical protein
MSLNTITSTLWDLTLAGFIIALTLLWPDIFPRWMALSAIPLLVCRAAISSLDRAQRI